MELLDAGRKRPDAVERNRYAMAENGTLEQEGKLIIPTHRTVV